MPFAPTTRITETCPHCQSRFHLDGPEDAIPAIKCADPHCEIMLCENGCMDLSAKCDGCDRRFCNEHLITLEPSYKCECIPTDVDQADASQCPVHNPGPWDRPDRFCAGCLEEAEAADWPQVPKLEPATAVVVPLPRLPEWGDVA